MTSRTLHTVALLLALLATPTEPARAQEGPDYPVPEVLAALDSGDAATAVGLLEPYRGQTGTPEPVLALLGLSYLEADQLVDALEILEPMANRETADAGVLYNAGRAALGLGSVEKAGGYLQRAAALAPGSPASRELGMLQGSLGDHAGCLVQLKAWARTRPQDQEARMAGAFCAVALNRAPDAEALLSDLPQDDPGIKLLWAKVLLLQQDPYGAIGTLEPMLGGDEPAIEGDVRRTLADAYTTVGQSGKAVEVLAGHTGDDPAVALQLARAQYQNGALEDALQTLAPFAERAVAMGADQDAGPLAGLRHGLVLEYGRFLVASGRHPEALPYLELATQVAPEDKLGWQSYGQALAAAGRTDEAQAALARFREITKTEVPASMKDMQLEQDTADPTGRELREAVKLLAQGRPEEALVIVRVEAKVNPGDPRPALMESRILLGMNQTREAYEAAERVVAAQPEYADGYYQRGAVRMALGELETAEGDLRRALELQPEHTAAMNDLAVLLLDRGDRVAARELLRRVLQLRPEDPVAKANLEALDR